MGDIRDRGPVDLTVYQGDHGLIMMALAHLAIERPEWATALEGIARGLHGHRMFIELRDLKMQRTRERRKQDAERNDRRTAARTA